MLIWSTVLQSLSEELMKFSLNAAGREQEKEEGGKGRREGGEMVS